jgi:hypothetical protein
MSDPNTPVLGWPLAPGERGREVWYGLVGPRDGSRAFWYRYTLLSTDSARREGRLWAAVTDPGGGSTFASESYAFDEVRATGRPFSLDIGPGELTSASAEGGVGDVSWSLSYDPDHYVFTPLRSQRLTDLLSRLAGTGKHWSRNEAVRVDGHVTVGNRRIEFEGAPGHQGHTLGSDPPEEWTWVQCNAFGDESVALEALNLDGNLSVCFRRDGETYPLNRVHHVLLNNRTEENEVGRWRFHAGGEGIDLSATVEADPDHYQRVTYCAPDDGLRYNAHCSVSSLEVAVEADGQRTVYESDAARAEWVGTEPPVAGDYQPTWD